MDPEASVQPRHIFGSEVLQAATQRPHTVTPGEFSTHGANSQSAKVCPSRGSALHPENLAFANGTIVIRGQARRTRPAVGYSVRKRTPQHAPLCMCVYFFTGFHEGLVFLCSVNQTFISIYCERHSSVRSLHSTSSPLSLLIDLNINLYPYFLSLLATFSLPQKYKHRQRQVRE